MKNINWKVRIRSKQFVVSLAAVLGMLVQDLGVMDLGTWEAYVDAILLVLVAGGIVVDPTTKGIKDSNQAMTYREPKGDD